MIIRLHGAGQAITFGKGHQFSQQPHQIPVEGFRMQRVQLGTMRELHLMAVKHLQHHKFGYIGDPALFRRTNAPGQVSGAGGKQSLHLAGECPEQPADTDGLNGGNKGVVQHQCAGSIFIEDTAQGEGHHRAEIICAADYPGDQLPQTDRLFVAFVSVKITDAGMGEAVTLRTLTGAVQPLDFIDHVAYHRQRQINTVALFR